MGINEQIKAVLDNPGASNWLKHSLEQALRRDPVDAANDAEVLHTLLDRRCDELLKGAAQQQEQQLTNN